MVEKILYWTTVFSSALALLLLIGTTVLITGNRDLQTQVSQRQTFINNGINDLQPLAQKLVGAMAESALKNKDEAIHDLLLSQGISVTKPEGKAAVSSDKAPKK